MMPASDGRLPLPRSLALVAVCLRPSVALALADTGDDPLRLDLPPLIGAGAPGIDAATLRGMGALYFQAELERAGVIPVVEMLADARAEQMVGSAQVAAKLEDFAQRQRRWYDRRRRNQLFARLFGFGEAATNEAGAAINREFEGRLAALCAAIDRFAGEARWGTAPSADGAVRRTAAGLALNLGERQGGNALVAGRLIDEQLRAALAILSDRELQTLFRAHGPWDLLRQILGVDTPDLGSLIDRAQSGLRIIDWLASVLDQLEVETSTQPLLSADSPVVVWAATWLRSTGLGPGAAERRAA